MQSTSGPEGALSDNMAVLAGTLAHLSSYLQTGCPRSLHVARLLLHRLDTDPAFDRDLLGSCRNLEEAVGADRCARRGE